jgi:hypothetical protein
MLKMPSVFRSFREAVIALSFIAIVAVLAVSVGVRDAFGGSNGEKSGHAGEVYALQAAFHHATTLHEPNDSAARVDEMLALWAEDGTLTLGPNTFSGKGVPGTDSCAPGSGTICDFFTNVAPPFQNRWISLSPSFLTAVDVHGNTASLYFECHFFDESWNKTIAIAADTTVVRKAGEWKFSNMIAAPIPLSTIPVQEH